MLLLYHNPLELITKYYKDLHSTMLLLYRLSQLAYQYKNLLFTFHYASTLSYWTVSGLSHWYSIYIPLCFYFIEYPVILRIRKADLHSTMLLLYLIFTTSSRTVFAYLHSTMLLLYPSGDLHVLCSALVIYIPLCFYFILLGKGDQLIVLAIYIPLCFYFICGDAKVWGNAKVIYIPLCFYFIN